MERPLQLQRHRCFPDPDPLPEHATPLADDVSGFNGERAGVYDVRCLVYSP